MKYPYNLNYIIIALSTVLNCDIVNSFEPINFVAKHTYCKFKECCNDDWIVKDHKKLKNELENKLYGQHIALEVVVNALAAHWADEKPQKPLTLSFHGWPGSGKNYVTKFIIDALYRKGSESNFVHYFNARLHFTLVKDVHQYQANLQEWIKGNVTNCKNSLFIFDEVEKMPPKVLDAIKPMIDYHQNIDKVDYRHAIFIFLSNTGSNLINDHLLAFWRRGDKRSDINLKDFEYVILKGAFNEKGGFHRSDTIKSNLIDHYIPFFPMEKEHVELCIKDQFAIRGINNPSQNLLNEVLEYTEWGPEPENIFSTTGCKRISQKVAVVAYRHLNFKDEF